MPGFSVRPIDDMQSINDGIVKLAGAELGVESFGVQVFDFPPDFPHYPEHDHGETGQEEVYVVLEGSAEAEVGGERVQLDRGRILRVEPATRRKLRPGPDGLRVLVIGSPVAAAYERADAFKLRP
jgi:mannose-6-phosphate isomerase-like protein (cupin superfamily)